MNNQKKPKKLIFFSVSAIIAVIIAATAFNLWKGISAERNAASARTTYQAQRGNIEVLVSATGTLQPLDYVDVGAQVSGQLKKIHVEVGSEVKSGDLLAEIDPTLFMAQVDASRAQLRYQRAQLKDREAQLVLSETQLKRQKNLYAEDATTLETVQSADAEYKSASAQLEMLKAQIDQTESDLRADEANLNYTKIYAPMDGTVVSVSARQGQTLNANQSAPTILQIADLTTMTVQTEVSEADIIKLKTGMRAYFTTLGSQGKRWYGELRRIEPTPTTENNVVLYNALFDVDNTERSLLPQMTAQVFFITASVRNAVLVPVAAIKTISQEQQKKAEGPKVTDNQTISETPLRKRPRQAAQQLSGTGEVIVVNSDGTTSPRLVKVGITNRIQAQITEGLEEGETVVLSSDTKTAAQRSGDFGPPPGMGMPRMR